MAYTVKQLAKISGVSVRTLHWYDEIELLRPAYIGANGYRYYEEEQLLLLQQILFFRELGFKLSEIQKVLASRRFERVGALIKHKRTLEKRCNRIKQLIETIDKTIHHLKGEQKMKEKEFYEGFDKDKQKEYEKYLVDYYGTVAEDLILESKKKTAKWDESEWKRVEREGNEIYQAITECMRKEQTPRSDEVQKLVHQHAKMIGRFYTVTKDVYGGLAQLYCEHPGFRKFFDPIDPNLAQFLAEAMRVYIHHQVRFAED